MLCRTRILWLCSLFLVFGVVVGHASQSDMLVTGQLTLVPASEAVPYAYWYYIPDRLSPERPLGIVWHATPGGSQPEDALFWARFDLPHFLACKTSGWPQRTVNLPEVFGLALISVAVPEPPSTFYEGREDLPLGRTVSLSSLGIFEGLAIDPTYHDPDLKALASINDFRRRLTETGISHDPGLFLTGVYSGAEWAHRFALLHPRELRAVAPVCGNVYTLPLSTLSGTEWRWPLGISEWETSGRPPLDWDGFLALPYLVTASWHENVWYNEMTPAEQGVDAVALARTVAVLGTNPPERAEAFARHLFQGGITGHLIWSDGGHGWVDSARFRVFEFFARSLEKEEPAP